MSELDRALRLCRRLHGVDECEIVEIERPRWWKGGKVAVVVGEADELTYEAPDGSRLDDAPRVHRFGDRGRGYPRSDARPILVTDPDGENVHILKVGTRSRYRVDARGIVG